MRNFLVAFPFLLFSQFIYGQDILPDDFNDFVVSDQFVFPTGITFDQEGRGFVWEKAGKVYLVQEDWQKTSQPLIDISEEVANFLDHGLMGFTLDANFKENGLVYLLYAVDLHHERFFGTKAYHPDTTQVNTPTFGRLVRYQLTADGNNGFVVDQNSRTILLGEQMETGIPLINQFHGLGTLTVGTDGTLLISVGDAASGKGPDIGGSTYNEMLDEALDMGIIQEDQDIGSYRSQYLGSYNGKILRIDPITGDGLPSNPFFDPENTRSPQSRIWAYGFRNPYRIMVKPNSGSHYPDDGDPGLIIAGDVGTGSWEEINIVDKGGLNFGWPLTEGFYIQGGFWGKTAPANLLAPNPAYQTGKCDDAYFTFDQLIALPRPNQTSYQFLNPCAKGELIPEASHPSVIKMPEISWSNQRWNPPAKTDVLAFNDNLDPYGLSITDPNSGVEGELIDGYSSMAGVFYTADQFPEAYHGKYFAFDHLGWIKALTVDAEGHISKIEPFHNDMYAPIHLALNPVNGNLYYTTAHNKIHCIQYKGVIPPNAEIETDTTYGSTPLSVQFSGLSSSSKNGPIVDYYWDFGDGTASHEADPTHVFKSTENGQAEGIEVSLTVTDSIGAASTSSIVLGLNNTPPVAEITSFDDGDFYPLDKTNLLELSANITDKESELEDLDISWEVFLHHNDHYHPEQPIHEMNAYTLISPLGCKDELYWYRIQLKVIDPQGLEQMVEQNVYPYCAGEIVDWMELSGRVGESSIHLEALVNPQISDLVYEVQRSHDYLHFEKVGVIVIGAPGKGTLTYTDEAPIRGTNIYRLKAVSEEELTFSYSNMVAFTYPKQAAVRVSPNPVRDVLKLTVQEPGKQFVFILFNPIGQEVYVESILLENDRDVYHHTFTLPNLTNGVYYYQVIRGESKSTGSVLLAR